MVAPSVSREGRRPARPVGRKVEAMGKVKSSVLAGAAMFVLIPGAFAADLPPMLPPAVPAPVEEFSGWYLRGDVGVGSQRFSHFDHTQTNSSFVWPASWRIDQKDIKDVAFVGFGLGYQWNAWLRTDVTGELRGSSKGKAIGSYTEFCPGGRCFDIYDFDHQASVILANVYFDLGTWWCLTPFVGAGIGGAPPYHLVHPRPRRHRRRLGRLRTRRHR